MRKLQSIATLSKKRSQGYGKVLRWQIEKVDAIVYWHEGRLLKNFPVDAPVPRFPDDIIYDMYEAGWTPPYWLETLFKRCLL